MCPCIAWNKPVSKCQTPSLPHISTCVFSYIIFILQLVLASSLQLTLVNPRAFLSCPPSWPSDARGTRTVDIGSSPWFIPQILHICLSCYIYIYLLRCMSVVCVSIFLSERSISDHVRNICSLYKILKFRTIWRK